MDFGNLVKNPSLVTGLVRAIILVAIALGLNLTPAQEAVILASASLAITAVTAFTTVGKAQVIEANDKLGLYIAKPKSRRKK